MSNILKRAFNWKAVKEFLRSSAMGALIGALVAFLLVFYFYQSPYLGMYQRQLDLYQKQLDIMNETLSTQNESLSAQQKQIAIMNESLVKRVQLQLEVIPNNEWQLNIMNNGSLKLVNTTLTIPRNNQTNFHVYVSNVGNAIAHLLYWTVVIFSPPSSVVNGGPTYNIDSIVLAPNGLYNMTYTYDPLTMGTGSSNEISFAFALMSAESTVYETVNATFR